MNYKIIKEWIDNFALQNNKANVIIFKGFPISSLVELSKKIPHLDNLSILTKEYKIDLRKIENNFWNIGLKLNNLNKGIYYLLYEEFLIIPQNVIYSLPVNFIILNNNFYDFYPNQSNLNYPDIEQNINSDIKLPNDELFFKFYTNSSIVADINCIQYKDYDGDFKQLGIGSFNIFNPDGLILPTFDKNIEKQLESIQFMASDDSYNVLKYSIFFEKIPKNVNLLVDGNIIHIKRDLNELKILIYLLKINNCNLFIYKKDNIFVESYRPELDKILKKHWGENAQFKKLKIYENPDTSKDLIEISQGAVVEYILKQYELARDTNKLFEDIFLTSPTGAGKSLLFQLPAIYITEQLQNKPVTIVISPLKALMADQVISLQNDKNFHQVAFLNSDQTLIERQEIINKIFNGDISVLYMSPELLLSYDIRYFIGERDIGLLVIDEAHLVTTWGRDFRVDYWFLGNYIRKLRRGSSIQGLKANKFKTYRFPVIAFTATAVYNGNDDMVFQTIGSLNMQNCRIYIGRIKREEIIFEFQHLITNSHEYDKTNKTLERINEYVRSGKKSIFYFPWINQIDNMYLSLSNDIKPLIKKYHAKLDADERRETLNEFKHGTAKCVMATKAFGMGVDISDIEIVYHHAPSGALSDYVQEIGRVARLPNMKGEAIIDFNPKDLKFTNILFGLSSLKNYQVNLVLEKLYSLYKVKNTRNLLVSIEDFQYIFTGDNNSEQKVKSALLVLEKDLLAKYGYNVLIVRPKSLFSTVFGRVYEDSLERLINDYKEFIEFVKPQNYTQKKVKLGKNTTLTRPTSSYSYFKIYLDKLWEKKYAEESFPGIKYKFFKKELIDYIEPLTKLSIHFKNNISETKEIFEKYIVYVERALQGFVGRYFTKEELIDNLINSIHSKKICIKLADLLTVLYSEFKQFGLQSHQNGNFLQVERKGNDYQFKVINTALNRIRSQLMRSFAIMFDGLDKDLIHYNDYLIINSSQYNERIKIAYMLEILELATYEISGGELPQLFIRINDPQKISSLTKSLYKNNVVLDVERRHKTSVEIMGYFFQNNLSNSDRWEYIEDYFLGNDVKKE